MSIYQNTIYAVTRGLGALIDTYAPQLCLFCDQPSGRPEPLCTHCAAQCTRNVAACPYCALPHCAGAPCPACQQHPPPLRIVAPFVYDRAVARLLHRWKYAGERRLVAAAARLALASTADAAVSDAVSSSPAPAVRPSSLPASAQGAARAGAARLQYPDRAPDNALPATARDGGSDTLALATPLHWQRRLQRGFNQSEDLLQSVMRHSPELARACRNARGVRLQRRRATPRQALASRTDRLRNLRDAFVVQGNPAGRPVLLVDDVCTTGATGIAMAIALRDAGASTVTLWCLARTPQR